MGNRANRQGGSLASPPSIQKGGTATTFQNFTKREQSNGLESALMDAINDHKSSKQYEDFVEAKKYFDQENTYIMKRAAILRKYLPPEFHVHRLPNSFYAQYLMEWIFYALGGGLKLDEAKKAKLGDDFDMSLLLEGVVNAAHGGVSWGFWSFDRVKYYSVGDGFPLLDEYNSDIMRFVHFWYGESDDNGEILNAEYFDDKGVTGYQSVNSGGFTVRVPFQAYRTVVRNYEGGEKIVVDTEMYSTIPIIPLYVNHTKKSELTNGFKRRSDAHDAISSNGVNGIEMNEGIIWLFNNWGGDDIKDMFEQILGRMFKSQDGEPPSSAVAVQPVESPYMGKAETLDRLERELRATFFMPAANEGRAVTATEIKDATRNLRIKSSILAWRVCQFAGNIFKLIGVDVKQDEMEYEFVDIIDETEKINNLSTQIADGYVDAEYARSVTLKPDEAKNIAERMELAAQKEAEETFSLQQKEENQGGGD